MNRAIRFHLSKNHTNIINDDPLVTIEDLRFLWYPPHVGIPTIHTSHKII